MESFGKFLAKKGVLSKEQLDEATEYLVVVGGRLGTNLVDLGMLDIEELDRLLSEHRGLSLPPAPWLLQPDPDALRCVPLRVAQRHSVLPLVIENRTLHLAMADPHDTNAVDEIRFASGLRVQAYLLSEAHLAFLRERFLGILRERRFVYLDPEWARAPSEAGNGRGSGTEDASAPVPQESAQERDVFDLDGQAELTNAETFVSVQDVRPRVESSVEANRVELESDPGPPVPVTQPGPLSPEEVALRESELESAPDREAISDCALRLARTYGTAVALFAVHRGVIRGCGALGAGVPRRTDGLFVPMTTDSVLATAAREGEPFRGVPGATSIDKDLFAALGRDGVCDAVILPVRIRDRVLNLLYADNGSHPLGESSVAALAAVSDCIARAYASLILLRKRDHC